MGNLKNFLAQNLDTDDLTVGEAVWMGALAFMGIAAALAFITYSVVFEFKLLAKYVGMGNVMTCIAVAVGAYIGMAFFMRNQTTPMERLTARANKNMTQQAKSGMRAK